MNFLGSYSAHPQCYHMYARVNFSCIIVAMVDMVSSISFVVRTRQFINDTATLNLLSPWRLPFLSTLARISSCLNRQVSDSKRKKIGSKKNKQSSRVSFLLQSIDINLIITVTVRKHKLRNAKATTLKVIRPRKMRPCLITCTHGPGVTFE